jgi:hypothetical protein
VEVGALGAAVVVGIGEGDANRKIVGLGVSSSTGNVGVPT